MFGYDELCEKFLRPPRKIYDIGKLGSLYARILIII